MFTYITGYSELAAEQLILSTKTGNAVKEKNASVWYEQQTENLYQIAKELRETEQISDVIDRFTVENIVCALEALLQEQRLSGYESLPTILQSKPFLKQIQRKQLKQDRKQQLQAKYRNLLDLREV